MDALFWIRIEAVKTYGRWNLGEVRAFKRKPDTSANEIAIKVNFIIPDNFFEEPRFEARIEVPETDVGPLVISTEVADNIAEVLNTKLGVNARITIAAEPDD